MTSTEYKSKILFPTQSVFKSQLNFFQQKNDSRASSLFPSTIFPCPGNTFMPNGNLLKRPSTSERRIQRFCPNRTEQENNFFKKLVFPITLNNSAIMGGPVGDSCDQSKISIYTERYGKIFQLDPNRFFLNETFNKQEKQENNEYEKDNLQNIVEKTKEEIKNDFQKEEEIVHNDNKIAFKEKYEIEKEKKLDLNTTVINNLGKKFFTNHNYGYKCTCSKTQCNRKYCECYNSGNYCVDCNCKNCTNKPPVNTYSNKRPNEIVAKMKKSKEICTCTKSGCNKNYCECFKNGNKCTSQCRCIGCENNEENQKTKNIKSLNYECCSANCISIVKNKISTDNIEIKRFDDNDYFKFYEYYEKKINNLAKKKRKREEIKNPEEDNQKKNKDNESNNYFNDSLFDKNGKVVLRHINIIHN